MTTRLAILVVVLAAGLAGFGWLHTRVMPYQAWASYQDSGWAVVAEGWGTVLHAWPIALAGLCAGGLLGLFIGGWLGNRAAELDLAEQRQAVQQAQVQAQAAIQAAQTEAQAEIQAIRAETDWQLQQADNAWAAARHAEQQTRQAQAAAEARVAAAEARAAAIEVQANQTLAEAEKRRRNAAGAAERRRRQLARQRSHPSA